MKTNSAMLDIKDRMARKKKKFNSYCAKHGNFNDVCDKCMKIPHPENCVYDIHTGLCIYCKKEEWEKGFEHWGYGGNFPQTETKSSGLLTESNLEKA